jgi:hypothetical protein
MVFSSLPLALSCNPRWAIGRAMSQLSFRSPGASILSLFDFENTLDLDGDVDGQRA